MRVASTITLVCALALPGCAPSTPPPEPPPPGAEERPRTRERPAPAPPTPDPTPEAAERLVLETYLETDTLGIRELVGRFRHGGPAATRDLLPEPEFCHVYFALAEGTYCYRAQYGEPFRTRPVDAFARAGASTADELLRRAPGVPYDSIRDLLFLREHVEARGTACASFFVRQVLRELEGARFETFMDAPAGLVVEGIACADRGARWSLYEPSEETAAFRLWDRARLEGHEVAVILREWDEVLWFEVYAIEPGTPTLLVRVEVWP